MAKHLRIRSVKENSKAAQLGIKEGDVLLSYDGSHVHSNISLTEAMGRSKGKPMVSINLTRGSVDFSIETEPGPLGIDCHEIESENGISSFSVKTDYGVAKSICSLVTFAGWATIVIGVIVVLFAFAADSNLGLLAIPSGVGLAAAGFFLIMGAQVTKAAVDTADYAREILKTLRKSE
jgi:hypothetical protein